MYRIMVIAILLALSSEENLYGQERVYGGYQNCTGFLYDYKDGIINLESKGKIETYKYDDNGYKIEYMGYYMDKPFEIYCCKNDSFGNKLEESFTRTDGAMKWAKAYKYDKMRNKIEEIEFNSDGSVKEKYTNKYDAKNREIEKVIYYGDSAVKEKGNTKYIGLGKTSEDEIFYYRLDGSIEEWRNYKYDVEGERQEWRIRNYDETGKTIHDLLYKSNGRYYDMMNPSSKDTVAGFFSIDGSQVFEKTTYEYDEKGRIILELQYSSEETVDRKYTYKYDDLGNTIERVSYKMDVPAFKNEYIYSK